MTEVPEPTPPIKAPDAPPRPGDHTKNDRAAELLGGLHSG
jgi:hypothetical protein